MALHRASRATRAGVLRGIDRVLREHAVEGEFAELHLTPPADAPSEGPCPDGTVRRMVCHRDQSGTLVCEERCVPV